MAFSCGFYNSIDHDRTYSAAQFGEMFDGLITDGVYATIGNAFMTVPGSGVGVIVKSGRAWFNKTWSVNTTDLPIDLGLPDLLLPRIDTVILEVDTRLAIRNNSIKVVTGYPAVNPAPAALTQSDGLYQYPLAYVTVPANATEIASTNIQVVVGQSPCPFVTGILQSIDITDAFQQWEGQFQEWFADVQSQLSGDIAGNLLHRIELLENGAVMTADKASEEDAIEGTSDELWMTPKSTKAAIQVSVPIGGTVFGCPDPERFLPADGTLVSVSDYPELFEAIGTSYGGQIVSLGGTSITNVYDIIETDTKTYVAAGDSLKIYDKSSKTVESRGSGVSNVFGACFSECASRLYWIVLYSNGGDLYLRFMDAVYSNGPIITKALDLHPTGWVSTGSLNGELMIHYETADSIFIGLNAYHTMPSSNTYWSSWIVFQYKPGIDSLIWVKGNTSTGSSRANRIYYGLRNMVYTSSGLVAFTGLIISGTDTYTTTFSGVSYYFYCMFDDLGIYTAIYNPGSQNQAYMTNVGTYADTQLAYWKLTNREQRIFFMTESGTLDYFSIIIDDKTHPEGMIVNRTSGTTLVYPKIIRYLDSIFLYYSFSYFGQEYITYICKIDRSLCKSKAVYKGSEIGYRFFGNLNIGFSYYGNSMSTTQYRSSNTIRNTGVCISDDKRACVLNKIALPAEENKYVRVK